MKRLAAPIIAILLLIPVNRAEALFGVGLKGVSDSFSVAKWTDGDGFFTLEGSGFEGSALGGIFIYVDALPFIDLEASFETTLAPYDLSFSNEYFKEAFRIII